MVLQINAEETDSLQDCLAKATLIANTLQVKVSFYYDRKEYTAKPNTTPTPAQLKG